VLAKRCYLGYRTCCKQGTAFGKQVRGATIPTRNHEGLIEHIQLYHSPLQVIVEFSRELAKRLEAEKKSGCTA
jgi:hypothetical protein